MNCFWISCTFSMSRWVWNPWFIEISSDGSSLLAFDSGIDDCIEYWYLEQILAWMSYQQATDGLMMERSKHHQTLGPSLLRFMLLLMIHVSHVCVLCFRINNKLPIEDFFQQFLTYVQIVDQFSASWILRLLYTLPSQQFFRSAVVSGCLFHFGQSC